MCTEYEWWGNNTALRFLSDKVFVALSWRLQTPSPCTYDVPVIAYYLQEELSKLKRHIIIFHPDKCCHLTLCLRLMEPICTFFKQFIILSLILCFNQRSRVAKRVSVRRVSIMEEGCHYLYTNDGLPICRSGQNADRDLKSSPRVWKDLGCLRHAWLVWDLIL